MKPVEVPPTGSDAILPGAQFADAYALAVTGQSLDALTAATHAFGRAPRWISGMLLARNILVSPFGLKKGDFRFGDRTKKIGIFPLLQQTERQVVLGLDDRHLDFRVLVEVSDLGPGGQTVTATTFVKTHNYFGRAYLQIVLPFHRLIMKTMLIQALRT